jgi:hypothetical protein
MKVRIIPEDYPNDHRILRPIFGAMFADLGKPHAKIDVHSPEIKGLEAVKNLDHIREIIADFPQVQPTFRTSRPHFPRIPSRGITCLTEWTLPL